MSPGAGVFACVTSLRRCVVVCVVCVVLCCVLFCSVVGVACLKRVRMYAHLTRWPVFSQQANREIWSFQGASEDTRSGQLARVQHGKVQIVTNSSKGVIVMMIMMIMITMIIMIVIRPVLMLIVTLVLGSVWEKPDPADKYQKRPIDMWQKRPIDISMPDA